MFHRNIPTDSVIHIAGNKMISNWGFPLRTAIAIGDFPFCSRDFLTTSNIYVKPVNFEMLCLGIILEDMIILKL